MRKLRVVILDSASDEGIILRARAVETTVGANDVELAIIVDVPTIVTHDRILMIRTCATVKDCSSDSRNLPGRTHSQPQYSSLHSSILPYSACGSTSR